MGADIVDLHGKPVALVEDHEFVVDLARFRENLLDEKAIRKKYRLADDVWEKLADDDELIRKVELESIRRVRDGSCKREMSQKLVVRAPEVLSGILLDNTANARHRIDSCKVLNDLATDGPAAAAGQSDRFIISINLSADGVDHVLHFDKPIKPNTIDDTQSEWLPVIETSKLRNDDGGEPL